MRNRNKPPVVEPEPDTPVVTPPSAENAIVSISASSVIENGNVKDQSTGSLYSCKNVTKVSNGLKFDSGYIKIGADKLNMANDFTIDLSYTLNAEVAYSMVFSNYNVVTTGSNIISLGFNGSGSHILYLTDQENLISSYEVFTSNTLNKQTQLTMVKKGNIVQLYKDKQLVKSCSNVNLNNSVADWYLGADGIMGEKGYQCFNGVVHHLFLYNRAVDISEL